MMFLGALERWTAEHRSELEARGVEVSLSERNATDKPAQRLTLSTQDREAELIVWVSGECETAIGRPDSSVAPEQIHYDFGSDAELVVVLDGLVTRLLAPAN